MSSPVIFGERPVAGDRMLGLILLNRPAQINAVNAAMFEQIHAQLDRWECDERIAAIGLAGAGERGFCAGGDVVSLYHLSQEPDNKGALLEAEAFFESEYRADARLHAWAKPVITLAHGICMGGGLGLARAGSHRVVTEDIRMAMPEVHIGFFPDVGSCSFLHELPAGLGWLLATTGVSINGAANALESGLATATINEAARRTFWDDVGDLAWTGNTAVDSRIVSEFLATKTSDGSETMAAANIVEVADALAQVDAAESFDAAGQVIEAHTADHTIFEAASLALRRASPMSMVLADRYFQQMAGRSPSEVLASDTILAKRCIRQPDFSEGVRSVLVDKTKDASWVCQSTDNVDEAVIGTLLEGT